MRATRKDVVRILRSQALAAVDAKIAAHPAVSPDNSMHEALRKIEDRAKARYLRRAPVRRLLQALDGLGVTYKVHVNAYWDSRTARDKYRYYVRVNVQLDAMEDETDGVLPVADQKRVETSQARFNKQRQELQQLQRRRALLADQGPDDIVSDTISQMVVEGDDYISGLLDAVSNRLQLVLDAATEKG